VWDTDMESFGLQVMASGDRTFVCHYRPVVDGTRIQRSRRMTLGGAMDAAGLAQAKNEARVIFGRLSGALATGQSCDPLGERKAAAAKNRAARQANADAGRFTMRVLFKAYTRSKKFRENRRHEVVAAAIHNHLIPRLGQYLVFELTRHQITE